MWATLHPKSLNGTSSAFSRVYDDYGSALVFAAKKQKDMADNKLYRGRKICFVSPIGIYNATS